MKPVSTEVEETHSGIQTKAQSDRVGINDHRPLAESLERDVGQHYYQGCGSKEAVAKLLPISALVNNDGGLSSRGRP